MTLETWVVEQAFASLGPPLAVPVSPQGFREPLLVAVSEDVAALVGLEAGELSRPEFARLVGGTWLSPGMKPVAMGYAGHQFGAWVPQLGDGRALLLGEVVGAGGTRWDLHLKGAGETPFSRQGDGRAVLRSTVREFLASEAMAALGVPTTRALAIVGARVPVQRETLEPAAMLLRVARSHVRFGSFEWLASRQDVERLRRLADFVIERNFPGIVGEERHVAWLREVVRRTASLVAKWMAVGFQHGVMNTDNFSILGDTLDYGPYGFMDAYEPGWICNHTDEEGRYAFRNQPYIAHWNCGALANALVPLIGEQAASDALDTFEPAYKAAYLSLFRAKLGLVREEIDDGKLLALWLDLLHSEQADHTRSWRLLCEFDGEGQGIRDHFVDRARFDAWAKAYAARLAREGSVRSERRDRMRAVNPRYVLRNWLAQRAIERAESGDFSEVRALHAILRRPFEDQDVDPSYDAEPPDDQRHLVVSCSS